MQLQGLNKRRGNAKQDVKLKLDYVNPLLKVPTDQAIYMLSRVNDSIKKVDSLMDSSQGICGVHQGKHRQGGNGCSSTRI